MLIYCRLMCVPEWVWVCLCVAVREVRLGELLLQIHVIFRMLALSLVHKDAAFFLFGRHACNNHALLF